MTTPPNDSTIDRRALLKAGGIAGALTGLPLPADARASASVTSRNGATVPDPVKTTLTVNGARHAVRHDARTTLLDWLRETAALTGTKKGCDHGQCGACTVLVDDGRVLSCLTLLAQLHEQRVTTIEGLGSADTLHPMQQAFIDADALQCGYCTPGQILSAVACVAEGRAGDADSVREWMSGNLCRCAAYPQIVAAVLDGARAMRG